MEETSSEPNTFSNYGIYKITDSLEISLPNTEIKIQRVSKNVFSYFRKNSDEKISEKIIPTKSDDLTIELSPIDPLNYPAKRTNYLYLNLNSPVFLTEETSATIYTCCPIEIGVFLVHDGHKDSLDWFTCDPINSRFGLYGSPESGTLCKYVNSERVEAYDDSIPFVNAVMKMDLKNELDEGKSITKIVFPLSEYSLYYKNNKAIFDTVKAVMKKKTAIETIDVSPIKIDTDWTLAPSYERVKSSKRLDMGVE